MGEPIIQFVSHFVFDGYVQGSFGTEGIAEAISRQFFWLNPRPFGYGGNQLK